MATRRRARGRKRPIASARRRHTQDAREQLRDVIRNLQLALSTVMVCIEALRRQNADLDADIALVLKREAGNRLHAEIGKLQNLLRHPQLA